MKSLGNEHILLCDNHLVVVDKPADICSQPDLVELAKHWIKHRFQKPGNVFLEPIHRLDKPVCGVILMARTSKALSRLQQQMRGKNINKIYHAWVENAPASSRGRLIHHLLHGSFRAEVSSAGKEAILTYETLYAEKGKSLLQITLETGRYHQIRAQMAAIGCPILGDIKYGSVLPWTKGIALCAISLSFDHPITQERVIVHSQHQLLPPSACKHIIKKQPG